MTVLLPSHFGLNVQWSALRRNIDRTARFYLIFIKSPAGNLLAEETVPGSTTTKDITGLRPSTRYRIVVYGIDETGQAYKTRESLASTTDGKLTHFRKYLTHPFLILKGVGFHILLLSVAICYCHSFKSYKV